MRRATAIAALLALCSTSAEALPPPAQEKLVTAARRLLGTPYLLGGRLREAKPGIDCQGLVFYALQDIQQCGWRSWSVFPTTSIPTGELGRIAFGPTRTVDLRGQSMEPGDVVWLLSAVENPAEASIGTLEGTPVWVWHVGLATEGGRFIHADPFSGAVIEVDLADFAAQHGFDGALVTRMTDGPAPLRCRRHRPMRR